MQHPRSIDSMTIPVLVVQNDSCDQDVAMGGALPVAHEFLGQASMALLQYVMNIKSEPSNPNNLQHLRIAREYMEAANLLGANINITKTLAPYTI